MFCCPGLMSKQYYWPMSVTWSNGFVKVHPMICMSAFNQRFTHQKLNSRTLYEQQLLGPNDITTTSYIHLMAFFSRTIWVSQHQKGKPFCILMKQEMMGRWWGGSVCCPSVCMSITCRYCIEMAAQIKWIFWIQVSLWNFVPNPELRKFCPTMLTVGKCNINHDSRAERTVCVYSMWQ